MAKKPIVRSKAQRDATQTEISKYVLGKKAAKKKAPREDFSQAAARIVREATDKV